jgi:hypothetical protein
MGPRSGRYSMAYLVQKSNINQFRCCSGSISGSDNVNDAGPCCSIAPQHWINSPGSKVGNPLLKEGDNSFLDVEYPDGVEAAGTDSLHLRTDIL